MSEFKLIGDAYISQWNGNSLNDGSENTPYAHPADVPTQSFGALFYPIIGTGIYKGHASGFRGRFKGDGKVIWETVLRGTTVQVIGPDPSGIHFRNFFSIRGQTGGTLTISSIDCIFEGCDQVYNYDGSRNCLFILTRDQSNQNNGGCGFNHIFIGSFQYTPGNLNTFRPWQYCFFSKEVTINFGTVTAGNYNNVSNNCINGLIIANGNVYELKNKVDGSPRSDSDPLIDDFADFYPNVYVNGNFATEDPKWIDVINKIVEPDSDLLKKSGTFGFIGGVRPGKKIPVNASDPDITITTTDIDTSDPVNWLIQSPATEGFINIIWKLSDNISEIQRIFLDALLQFDGSEVGGSVGNNNVPDNFPASYSPLSQAGLKPNRLLYEFRTSQSLAKPTSDAQWDNDNVALGTTAGDFYLQEWNTKPTITTILGVAYGNGNPESIGGSNNGINARWGHAKIRLTNNRAY